MKVYAIENHPNDSRVTIDPNGIVQTLSSRMGTGGNNTPFVLITSTNHDLQNGNHTKPQANVQAEEQCTGVVKDSSVSNLTKAYMAGNGQLDQVLLDTVSRTLDCMHDQKIVLIENEQYSNGRVDNAMSETKEENKKKYVLRRLTPTECARLQGFPDWWCDGANGSDSAQYKLWGNGIALPCAVFILGNIAEDMKKDKAD